MAEIHAADKLGLNVSSTANEPGFDALDTQGRRYQIKYRSPGTQNIDVNNFNFDFLVLVGFDDDCALEGMWLTTVEEVKAICVRREKFRKSQTTQDKFKRIAKRIV